MQDSPVRLAAPLSQYPSAPPQVAVSESHSKAGPMVRTARTLGLALAGLAVLVILLLTVGPIVAPYKVLTVYSGSMEPTIKTGSVIVVVPVAAGDVKIGDIITFQRPTGRAELVTHRVVAFEGAGTDKSFITKGDANSASDGWRIPANGSGYRYWFGVPGIGYGLAWLQSPLGRILFLVIPAAALGALTLYELWRPRRTKVAEREP